MRILRRFELPDGRIYQPGDPATDGIFGAPPALIAALLRLIAPIASAASTSPATPPPTASSVALPAASLLHLIAVAVAPCCGRCCTLLRLQRRIAHQQGAFGVSPAASRAPVAVGAPYCVGVPLAVGHRKCAGHAQVRGPRIIAPYCVLLRLIAPHFALLRIVAGPETRLAV